MKIKVLLAVLVLMITLLTSCDESVAPADEDTGAPTVKITHPADDTVIHEPVTIVVSATDNSAIAKVLFFVDGQFIAEDIAAPYEYEWDPGYRSDGGEHELIAKAEDSAGNIGVSSPIQVTVSFSPGPVLISPVDEIGFPDSDTVDLSWSPVTGAMEYRVQLSTRLDFSSTAMDVIQGTPGTTTSTLMDGWYFWRVRAKGSDDLWSGWSDVRVFLIGGTPTTVPTFSRTYGSYLFEEAYAVKETSDGGFLVTGRQDGDLWLLRTDAQGEEIWSTDYTGLNFFIYHSDFAEILFDPMLSLNLCDDGGSVVCGAGLDGGFHLRKYDSLGEESWRQVVGDSLTDPAEGWDAIQMPGGGVTAVGMISWSAGIYTYGGIGVIRTDAAGDTLWTHIEGNTDDGELGLYDSGRSLAIIGADQFIITGTDLMNNGQADLILMKVDTGGGVPSTEWSVHFDNSLWDDYGNCVRVTADGGFVVCGYSLNPSEDLGPDADLLVIKTDNAGAMEWDYIFSGPSEDYGQSLVQTADGGYLIVGLSDSPYNDRALPAANLLLIKLAADGSEEWVESYGLTYAGETGFSIDTTSDGGFIICGSQYTVGGDSDFLLLKLDEEGNINGNGPPEH